jgi:hypothetical protein
VAECLRRDGYAIIDFPEPDIDQLVKEVIEALEPRYDFEKWRRDLWPVSDGLRLQDAWVDIDAVRKIACNTRLLEILDAVYGRPAFPFQTLNFPVGTQQTLHSDAVFFSSAPDRFMCGVWLAFEDIDDDNGPLTYYAGSHRLPMVTNEMIGRRSSLEPNADIQTHLAHVWPRLAEENGLTPMVFHAKKSQAVIWSAHLLHGGKRHLDPDRTRWSQVTHYYFRDCVYWTPVESDFFAGTVRYRTPIDLLTGKVVPNAFTGPAMRDIREVSSGALSPKAKPTGTPSKLAGRSESWGNWIAGVPNLLAAGGAALFRGFNANDYVKANPDVGKENIHPLKHWLRHGHRENRRLRDE